MQTNIQYFTCNCEKQITVCSNHDCPRKLPKITINEQPNETQQQKTWRKYYNENWETQAYTCKINEILS